MARKSGEKPSRAAQPRAAMPSVETVAVGSAGFKPWHLLLLATAVAVAASLVVTRGTSMVNVVSVAVAVGTMAFAAAAAYRAFMPLVSPEVVEQTDMLAGRTRAALEREKMLVLRSIKEVEFDRAMRKISDADYQEMVGRLRVRAAGLMRQLDGNALGYREVIERELATRVGAAPVKVAPAAAKAPAAGTCPACQIENDTDARFCKSCGARLTGAA